MNVAGLHAVSACLRATPDRVLRLSVQRNRRDSAIKELIHLARSHQIQVSQVNREALDRISEGAVHQGVVAHCQAFEPYAEEEFKVHFETLTDPVLLALEDVQDPRNLGACLRSAAGAGVDGVLLPRSRSAPISGVTYKSASGALSSLYVASVANLVRSIQWLKAQGVWVVGADDSASQSYLDFDFSVPTLLVIGSEGRGLRELTKQQCDAIVSIPMSGDISSLNVAVATGVVLYECLRQRNPVKD